MPDYNVQAEIKDIILTKGDTVNLSYDVYEYDIILKEWVLFVLTGMQLDLHVRKCDGTLIAHYSSAGVSPEITISGSSIHISSVPFSRTNKYKYDLQIIDGSEIMTGRKGNWIVQMEITV